MSDQNIKIKVTVDAAQAKSAIRLTRAEMEQLSRHTAKSNAVSHAGTGAWTAYTGAMKMATSAVRGFFSALGVVGAVISGIHLAMSLFGKLKEKMEAPERAAKAASEKLSETRKKVEELNQARLESAQKAMRGFADETARARDNANALISAVNNLASAQAAYDSSKIDLAVSHGEMTKEEGDLAKAKIASSAAMDTADANKAQKWENLQAAKSVVANFEHQHPELADIGVGDDGRVDTLKSKAYKDWDSAKTISKLHAKDPDLAKDKHNEEIARQNWAAFIQTARDYESALAALEVATKEYDAALLQGDAAINKALAAEKQQSEIADKGVTEAREKSERERAKAQVDWEVQRGEKSEHAGSLEKQRIDLEAELKAAREALETRRKADEEAGRDTEADDVLATLANTVSALEYKLDVVNDKARKVDEGTEDKVRSSSSTISSDQWARIGAFAGGGAQTETLRIQRGSYDALTAIKEMTQRIQGHFINQTATTL